MSHFDHISLRNAKLCLNSTSIRYENLNLNFDKNYYAKGFKAFTDFQKFYLGKKTMEPSLKVKSVDIRLECEFSKNIPENTTAYCLIINGI